MNIMALLGSSRRNGNTEYLVEKALKGVKYKSIYLLDVHMEPIVDQRHESNGFDDVDDEYEKLFKEFLNQDIIVFATPLYWFGMSGQMKTFFDRWSQYMWGSNLRIILLEKPISQMRLVMTCTR